MRRWKPWIVGAVTGLYVSRVWVEFAPVAWPAPWLWSAGVALGLVGFGATVAIHAFGCDVTPAAALALYLVSPTIDPRTAGAVAFVTVAAIPLLAARDVTGKGINRLTERPSTHLSAEHLADVGVLLLGLLVYLSTLPPGLLPADSGEFQLVAPALGIAHPPGYALYTLVGKLFTSLPIGTPAYELNLMSALVAAATLWLVSRTTRQITGSTLAGLAATLALAGATTFWAQATTANIRMPTALLAALLIWLSLRYTETPHARGLAIVAFVSGLGLTHHGSLVFVVVPAALYVLWNKPGILRDGRLLVLCAAAFALALQILLYFPIRGGTGAPLDPGGLTTLDGFLEHVLARGFRGDILAFTGRQAALDRLPVLLDILTIQFGWPLLLVALLGLGLPLLHHLPRPNARNPNAGRQSPSWIRHWLLLTATFALTAGAAITYRAPQTVEYLMPAYVSLAILMGVGTAGLARLLPSPSLQAVTLSVALLLGTFNIWTNAPSYRELSRTPETRNVVEPILRDAPAGGTILSNWHCATALWYLQTVEGLRSDVSVEYVAPAGAEPYPETWRRRLADVLDRGPIVVTNRYRTYADLDVRLVPFHQAFLATTSPIDVPDSASRLDATFGEQIELLGYAAPDTRLNPGSALTVRLWWQTTVDAERDYSVFVHLIDGAGRPVGQADVRYPAGRLRRGTLIEDTYTLTLLPTVPPGDYRLVAGFYFTPPGGGFRRLTTHGADAVELGSVTLSPRRTPAQAQHRLAVPFAGGPTLVGVSYDGSWPRGRGQTEAASARVYLHWKATPAGPTTATLFAGTQPVGGGTVPPAPAGSFVTTAADVPSATRALRLALSDANGTPLAGLAAWRLPLLGSSVRLPEAEAEDRYLVFGGEMALLDAGWERHGNEVVVELAWLSLQPLVRDYTVSVQLLGESGWRAQHDGTPALGAIPTLKWIRGTRVRDRHRIALPEGAAGPAEVQISVYDAFTQTPLGVLDARFQRAGQGQAAVIGQLPAAPESDG